MIDYIKNRLAALRNNNVLDFMTEYMRKRGEELEGFRGRDLQDLQRPLQSLHYAKDEKRWVVSEVKQTTYRSKEEDL